ncbi:MAG: hypothetical protein IH838_06665 [Proteobacteria bacterium]|nr:hypothetical protein [Pseudomonadota bacterium]
MNSPVKPPDFRQLATKETALLAGFLFFGLVIMPFLIFKVGQTIFGAYGGIGYGDFFGTLSSKVRHRDPVAWFLILSPYLGWQCLRLTAFAWRAAGRTPRST